MGPDMITAPPDLAVEIRLPDAIDGGDVVPEFNCAVSSLFDGVPRD